MTDFNWVLVAGGCVGMIVALIHGVVMQRFIVRPIGLALAGGKMARGARKLVTPVLHYSTFAWFIGGLAVVTAALLLDEEARLAIGLLVGASYLYAGIANLWGTRGAHPGGWLMALAVGLIGFGIA